MFDLFKKTVDPEKVVDLKSALAAIDLYIYMEEWENAQKAIDEIKINEKDLFIESNKKNIDDEKALTKTKKVFDATIVKIWKLEKKYTTKKSVHDKKIEAEIFKLRFKKVSDEIKNLIWLNKNNDALNLLTNFLEEHKEKSIVVTFFAKEKKKILNNIEKIKKQNKNKIKESDEIEALKLIWETIKEEKKVVKKENLGVFGKFKEKLNIYAKLKERIKKKKLLDEVKVLIEEENKIKSDIARKKLENIHKWLAKELNKEQLIWYDIYWKILGHDKISWDTFDFDENSNEYNFFLWDATGHWVRAWLIISLLSRNFNKFSKLGDLKNLVFKINNTLKDELESRNFVTWVFFRINKREVNKIDYVWMWHEPMLVYKNKEKKVEKVIPGWLAIWIRKIKEIDDIKVKEIALNDNDIVLTYSDWVTDIKNNEWDFYWIDRLIKVFSEANQVSWGNVHKLYNYIIEDLELFRWWTNFSDDTTMLIVRRNKEKDIMTEGSEELQTLVVKEWLDKKDAKKLLWKNEEWVKKELGMIKKWKETKHIISILENLYLTWEILKLKEEATRFIKDWYIHSKINFYLKKAIANETTYKIGQKNQRMQNRYNTLLELYKSWDLDSVVKECQEIIIKNGER